MATGGSVFAWSITGVRGGLEVAGAGAFSSISAMRLSDADSRCRFPRDGEDWSTEAADAGGTADTATTDCATGGAASG